MECVERKVNKILPYLVRNAIELLDMEAPKDEDDEAVLVLDNQTNVPLLRHQHTSSIITLPAAYDARVKAMKVDERPTEQYSDIGGLDKQIQELIEAVVLPMTYKEKFKILGILLYGPPGTGKTLLACACAAQTKSTS
uniref:ATPase AAA-type core domain-containing protein n=1 Tax=Glossina austeni TaxID=7395 RepID=A0A1A9UW15_GLOAU